MNSPLPNALWSEGRPTDGSSFDGDRAESVGDLRRYFPVGGVAGATVGVCQCRGDDGGSIGWPEVGEADPGQSRPVEGDDTVVGASTEAGDRPDGYVAWVLGHRLLDGPAEPAAAVSVIAGTGAADEQGHGSSVPGVVQPRRRR